MNKKEKYQFCFRSHSTAGPHNVKHLGICTFNMHLNDLFNSATEEIIKSTVT